MMLLVVSALAKVLFVLLVTVGAFAPILVWAERRQSAMIQDRLGPERAGIVLPAAWVRFLHNTAKPCLMTSWVAAVTLLVFAGFAGAIVLGKETVVGLDAHAIQTGLLVSLIAFVVLRTGYEVHTLIVRNNGNIALLGLLHPLADAIKFIFKEDFVPPRADKWLHALAPMVCLVPAIVTFAVIPFADVLYLDYWNQVLPREGAVSGMPIPMQIADINIGILFVFAVGGTGVIGAAIGGYASDNKFSLLGGLRAASQMVSYEVALGLTLVPCFLVYNTLRLDQMALWQSEHYWGIIYPPLTLSAILFFTAAVAETKRIPFDLPEGESELVGGYLTEYSGMKFGMFFMSEFVEVVALAAIASVIFFGGWDVPFLYRDGFDLPGSWQFVVPGFGWQISDHIYLAHAGVIALQVVAFLVKITVLIWFQLMVRWTLPRFRYDQVMALCWKGLLPLSLVNILVTAAAVLWWTKG